MVINDDEWEHWQTMFTPLTPLNDPFPKLSSATLECIKKRFGDLSYFRTTLAHASQFPKSLEKGHFGTEKGSRRGQKGIFLKVHLDGLRC